MKVVVSSQGETLDAAASPIFGRCPTYVFVDTETNDVKAMPNPAMNQGGGAGIQAAQFVVSQGAQAVLTGNLGPNAYDVLQAADVPGYLVPEGTVRQAVDAFKAGNLQPMGGANVASHSGMGVASSTETDALATQAELAKLRETLRALRQQLAETMEQIEKLESKQ
jgi:predicted Fe-Mo cluster-binding NifX family protein